MGTNHVAVEIHQSPAEAPDYKGSDFKAATLDKAVIVRKGTSGGHDTVDLQFSDEAGNKYVALVTGRILKSIAGLVNAE